ncbi:hypothetical protein EI94DRAFT_1744412 [Lactarius quietus]|nr:hypothetical protein EI94DRAFT_1744412 [Lactarius quietus]
MRRCVVFRICHLLSSCTTVFLASSFLPTSLSNRCPCCRSQSADTVTIPAEDLFLSYSRTSNPSSKLISPPPSISSLSQSIPCLQQHLPRQPLVEHYDGQQRKPLPRPYRGSGQGHRDALGSAEASIGRYIYIEENR